MSQYLDDRVLQELHAVLGDDLLEIVAQFIDQLQHQSVGLVDCHASGGDPEKLASLAHAIKGSAGNMGAAALASAAARIEKLAKSEDHSEIGPIIATLPELTRQTVLALRNTGYAPTE